MTEADVFAVVSKAQEFDQIKVRSIYQGIAISNQLIGYSFRIMETVKKKLSDDFVIKNKNICIFQSKFWTF